MTDKVGADDSNFDLVSLQNDHNTSFNHYNSAHIPGVPLELTEEFGHVFAQHSRAYQKCMYTRQEHHRNMKHAVTDLENRLKTLKKDSNALAERMLDTNEIIEGERKKWKELLHGEKAKMYT